ncbi:hypothetical protein [Vibrio harveyi]
MEESILSKISPEHVALVTAVIALISTALVQVLTNYRVQKEFDEKLKFEKYQYKVSVYEKVVSELSELVSLVNQTSMNQRDFAWVSRQNEPNELEAKDYLHKQFNLLTDIAKPMFNINVYVPNFFPEIERELSDFRTAHVIAIKAYLGLRDGEYKGSRYLCEQIDLNTRNLGKTFAKLQQKVSEVKVMESS